MFILHYCLHCWLVTPFWGEILCLATDLAVPGRERVQKTQEYGGTQGRGRHEILLPKCGIDENSVCGVDWRSITKFINSSLGSSGRDPSERAHRFLSSLQTSCMDEGHHRPRSSNEWRLSSFNEWSWHSLRCPEVSLSKLREFTLFISYVVMWRTVGGLDASLGYPELQSTVPDTTNYS